MKILNLILLVFLIFNTSCDSFLDVKSNKALVVVQTVDDALALLDDYVRMNEGKVPSWGESASDDYYILESALILNLPENQKFYIWDYQEYFGHVNDWGYGYQPIYNANLALDLLRNIERTPKNADVYDLTKGSALFFRSFYFYNLLGVFSKAYDENTAHEDLGIVLRLTSDFNVKSFRSSVKECFEQIEKDLKESAELLPNHPTIVTRASKAAAYATLARLYLYKRDYEQALYYSVEALKIKSDLMDFNGDEDVLTTVNETASPFKKFNKETIFYAECTSSPVYTSSGSRAGIVDSILLNSYEPNDLREKLFFRTAANQRYFKGHYTNSTRLFGGLSTNELYLIKSESLAYFGKDDESLNTLNQLLEKRVENYEMLQPTTFSNLSILELVRLERRKELTNRNLRFSDIKRYNKEGANIYLRRIIGGKEYILEPNSEKYALPLPADLIKITGMEQN